MNPMQDSVTEFHTTYGAPVAVTPTLIPEDRLRLRANLMLEELDEYVQAAYSEDLVEIADALGDLLYVVFGTAIEHGIDMQPIVEEIHLSNMSKLGADGKPIYREDGKVLKGPEFFRPAIMLKLEEQGYKPQEVAW